MTLYTLKAMIGAKGEILTTSILSLLLAVFAFAQDPAQITPYQLPRFLPSACAPLLGCRASLFGSYALLAKSHGISPLFSGHSSPLLPNGIASGLSGHCGAGSLGDFHSLLMRESSQALSLAFCHSLRAHSQNSFPGLLGDNQTLFRGPVRLPVSGPLGELFGAQEQKPFPSIGCIDQSRRCVFMPLDPFYFSGGPSVSGPLFDGLNYRNNARADKRKYPPVFVGPSLSLRSADVVTESLTEQDTRPSHIPNLIRPGVFQNVNMPLHYCYFNGKAGIQC